MRRLFLLSLCILLLFNTSCRQGRRENTISISGAWALYPLTVKWAEEYKKLHPEIRIDLSAGGAGKGITDVLNGLVDIGMVSRELYPQEREMGALSVAVAKDAVVAVINEKNPVAREIILRGVKPEELYTIWISGTSKTWGQITGSDTHSPIHPYTRSDACGAADVWASLMGKKQEDLNGTGVYGDPGLAQAVKQDSLGIGFNNIGYIFNISSGFPIQGLLIVPLDLNSNGIIDDDEKFYNTLTDLTKAIAAGKYPSPPSRQLYFVINGKSEESRVVNGFIEWVLGEGQNFVGESGYVSLSDEILADGRKILR